MERKEFREKLQTLINKEKFCWVCGRTDILTKHHVLNHKLEGLKMNVTIPVCKNCQEIIHFNDTFMSMLKSVFLYKKLKVQVIREDLKSG